MHSPHEGLFQPSPSDLAGGRAGAARVVFFEKKRETAGILKGKKKKMIQPRTPKFPLPPLFWKWTVSGRCESQGGTFVPEGATVDL